MQCHKLFCQGIKKANYPPPVIIMSWMSRDTGSDFLLVDADQHGAPIGGDAECRLQSGLLPGFPRQPALVSCDPSACM